MRLATQIFLVSYAVFMGFLVTMEPYVEGPWLTIDEWVWVGVFYFVIGFVIYRAYLWWKGRKHGNSGKKPKSDQSPV